MSNLNRERLSGSELVVASHAAPLPGDSAAAIAELVTSELYEPFLEDILTGRTPGDLAAAACCGMVAGELAGTCWCGWRTALPELGALGGVVTRPEHRRRGIARTICAELCERFDVGGGRLLWLATVSEVAQRMYEALGFRLITGHLMCRQAPGSELDEGFTPGQQVTVHGANWGDLPALMTFYAWPHPCVVLDAGTKLPSMRLQGPDRCIGTFSNAWSTTVLTGGRWEMLENEAGWLVGSVVARPTEQTHGPVFQIDFVWHPLYQQEGCEFVADFISRLHHETGRSVGMVVCKEDEWKLRQARALGFGKPQPTPETITIAGKCLAMLSLVRTCNAD